MEPSIGRAPISAVYETAESLSILRGHSITGSPIIVKCKSVPAPFTLQGSPQQDWGCGSLPHRNLINWSGWLDSHRHGLRSERSSQLLTHSLICMERPLDSATRTTGWKPIVLLLNYGRIFLERHMGVAPILTDWQPAVLLLNTNAAYFTMVRSRRIELRSQALQASALPTKLRSHISAARWRYPQDLIQTKSRLTVLVQKALESDDQSRLQSRTDLLPIQSRHSNPSGMRHSN